MFYQTCHHFHLAAWGTKRNLTTSVSASFSITCSWHYILPHQTVNLYSVIVCKDVFTCTMKYNYMSHMDPFRTNYIDSLAPRRCGSNFDLIFKCLLQIYILNIYVDSGFRWDPFRTDYRKISNIRRTKSQSFNVFRLGLQLSLRSIFKPSVKWRMKM